MDEASAPVSPVQRRVHNRKVPLRDAKQGLRRAARQLQRRTDAKIEALPEGFYVTMLCCVHEDRAGIARVIHEVIGRKEAVQFLEEHRDEIIATCSRPVDDSRDADEKYLEIPGNAEKRAEKVRELLREAWSEHVRGTPFHKSKQMYNAVEKKGANPFPWWGEVTGGAPFVNTTVADPGISKRIYEYLGPRLYASTTGKQVPGEEEHIIEEEIAPVAKCLRNMWCVSAKGHRGKCRLRPPPSIVPDTLPAVTTDQEEENRQIVHDVQPIDAVVQTGTTVPSKATLLKLMKRKTPALPKAQKRRRKPKKKALKKEDEKKKRVMNRRQENAACSKLTNMRKAGFAV